jgi:hypothetical protein
MRALVGGALAAMNPPPVSERTMHRILLTLLFVMAAAPAWAAPKSCAELKQEIETKIQAAGVVSYTLEIVDKAEAKDPSMVVGSCEYGSKKIIYQKNGR